MVEGATTNVSIFVPVLVLVVIEIAQAAREFDLKAIAEQKQEPFFYSVFYLLDKSSQETIRIPQLGPFNFIHGMNLGILYLGYVLVITNSQGSTRIVTALIIWLFWVLFPMLEVSEYVIIMDDPNVGPISFLCHSIVTTVSAVIIFVFGGVVTTTITWPPQVEFIVFVLGIVLLFYADLISFLTLLEGELERANSAT